MEGSGTDSACGRKTTFGRGAGLNVVVSASVGSVRIWVTLLQRSVRSHDHLELRVDIILYARRLYSLPAKTQLNISLLALSLTAPHEDVRKRP